MDKQQHPLEKEFNYVKKKYKLLSDLGQGTYGKVLLAKHRDTKQHVAIKFIKTDFKNSIMCRDLIREISILRQLSELTEL